MNNDVVYNNGDENDLVDFETLGILFSKEANSQNNEADEMLKRLEATFPNTPIFRLRQRKPARDTLRASGQTFYASGADVDWDPGDSYEEVVEHIEAVFGTTPREKTEVPA